MALQFMRTVKLLQLQPKTVKVTREFAVLAARMIPLPGKGDPISLDQCGVGNGIATPMYHIMFVTVI